MIIRGARGLGDAILVYQVVKYFINKGERDIIVKTNYPEIFEGLPVKTVQLGDLRYKEDINCRYGDRYSIYETNILQDTAIMAGIKEPLSLQYKYKCDKQFKFMTNKKVCVIRNPAYPMNYKKKNQTEILVPRIEFYQRIIDEFKDRLYFILLGWGDDLKPKLTGIDEDLSGTSNISELFAIIDSSDVVLTQPGYMCPMAESLNKKLFVIFSARGMRTNQSFYRHIRPAKVLTKKSSIACTDREPIEQIIEKFGNYIEEGAIKRQELKVSRKFVDNFFKNKSVLILGSAPSAINMPAKKMDGFNIIVRVNNYEIFNECKRVDVYYSFLGKSIRKSAEQIKGDGCKLIYCKCPIDNTKVPYVDGNFRWIYQFRHNWFILPYYISPLKTFNENSAFVNQVMTTGMSAIVDILRHNPKRVHIAGFDFFTSGLHNISARSKWKGARGHNHLGEANIARKLIKNGWITCEPEIEKLLNNKLVWNFQGQIKQVEE